MGAKAAGGRGRTFVLAVCCVLAPGAGLGQRAPASRPARRDIWRTALRGLRRYEVRRDVTYARVGAEKLLLDAYVPTAAGPHPAVLVVHGGAWRSGNKQQLSLIAHMLAGRRYVAFAINYRLAPRHRFPAQIEDCRRAVRWIVAHAGRYKADAARLGAMGYSAGGHLVAMLAVQGVEHKTPAGVRTIRLKAVAAGGAPCDFRPLPADSRVLAYWLGGTRAEKPKAYEQASPAALVSPSASPVFFYHGGADRLVPAASPRAMCEALRRVKVDSQFCVIPGAGHIPAALNLPAMGKAFDFLGKHLRAEGANADEANAPPKREAAKRATTRPAPQR